jgi:hypothetical protein
MRLLSLLLAPKSGRMLRARVMNVLRTEGLGGIGRRLHGPRG